MKFLHRFAALGLLLLLTFTVFADDLPEVPNPPKLVNDFAGMMNDVQQADLEGMLEAYTRTTSTRITIVTISTLNGRDISEYTTALGNKWKIGQSGKNNGVLILASLSDRKMWIASGYGMEGVLPDATIFSIVNNEMKPEFKTGNYYQGFLNAVNAIQAASKGEYTNDNKDTDDGKGSPIGFIVLIIIIIIVLAVIKGGGGRGGGNYMSRRGGDFLTGAILGSLLNGGGRSGGGGSWGGGSSSGGGGFGGFGGGSFGGGGAGGSW